MKVLGISPLDKDSTVTIVEDGAITFAAAEERFTRIKLQDGFPWRALQAGLELTGIEPADIDVVAYPFFSWQEETILCRRNLEAEREFIVEHWPLLRSHCANGSEVEPSRVAPRLELIEAHTWQSNLFRMSALTWSVPVSQVYGRRMRFLVWDETNCKLIGLIALADPVFNLAVRDKHIGWTAEDRRKRLAARGTTCCR